MENEKSFDLRKLAVPLGAVLVIGLVAGYFLSGLFCSAPLTPAEMIRQIEKNIARTAPGEDGSVLASIEGDVITRKLFDLQLNLFLQSGQYSQEEIVRRRNSPETQKLFLRQLVENRVVVKAMETEPEFQNNAELMVFLNLAIADGLQKYYLFKKTSASTVSTNVSQEELAQAYNQLNNDPQYHETIARVPFAELLPRLKDEIIRMRRLQEVREQLDKVRNRLRIDINDEVFGKTTDSTNGLPPLFKQ